MVLLLGLFKSKTTWIVLFVLALLGGIFYIGYDYSSTKRDKQDLTKEVVTAKEETAAIKETFQKTADAINTDAKITTKVIYDTKVVKEEIEKIVEAAPVPVSKKVLTAIDWVQTYKPTDTQEAVKESEGE